MKLKKLNWVMVGLLIIPTMAHAGQNENDKFLADATLRNLHDLAKFAYQFQYASENSDLIGCQHTYAGMQQAAHEALTNMHAMSFPPIDSIGDVAALLRVSQLNPSGCSDEMSEDVQFISAGQAIIALRYDYSIGGGDWYTPAVDGHIEAENPIQYAQTLKSENYSWVSVRPKGMIGMVESNWTAEFDSYEVDDPSIENSGSNLDAVEVDYRKNPGDSNGEEYFYRTKDSATAAVQATKQQAEDAATADDNLRESRVKWSKKLTSISYMIGYRAEGFKLVYDVCRDTGKKDSSGASICAEDASRDWSDTSAAHYRWFQDSQACEDAQLALYAQNPPDVRIGSNDAFVSACVPSPKWNGLPLKGYEMVFALVPPGAADSDAVFAELRDAGSTMAHVFKSPMACEAAMNDIYSSIAKDLGVDKDGYVIGNKAEFIGVSGECVRSY